MKIIDFEDIDSARLSHDEKTIIFYTWETNPETGEKVRVQVQLDIGGASARSVLRLVSELVLALRVQGL